MKTQSTTPFGVRLENSDRRLMSHGNERERIAAEFWQKYNAPCSMQGHIPLEDIIGQGLQDEMDPDAIAIANTLMQWLGSHGGAVYVRNLIEYAAKKGHPFHEIEHDFPEVREAIHRLA